MIGKNHFEIGGGEWVRGATSASNTVDGGFSNQTDQVNITSVQGVLYAPPTVTDESTNLEGEVIASCNDNAYLGKDRFLLDDEAKFYWFDGSTTTKKATASTATFTQGTTDMVEWLSYVYATTSAGANGDIVRYDKATTLIEDYWSNAAHLNQANLLATTSWRPLLVYESNLYIGDGNLLHRVQPDLTVTNGILTLAANENISALGVDQGTGQMLIATSYGADYSGSNSLRTRVYLYDGYSNKARRVVPISGLVTAFRSVGNTTFVFYGNKLGYWTGSGIEYLRTLNFAKGNSATLVYKNRACSIDNTLYWTDTNPATTYHNQVMAYGETVKGVSSFYPVYAGSTSAAVTAIFPTTSDNLGISYATDKFITLDTDDVTSSSGFDLYSKRYVFPRNVTFNGALIELDQAAPSASDTSLSFRVIDDKGNTSPIQYLVTGGRTDIYTWQVNYPTVETRSLQFRLGRASDSNTLGVRRMTVFYTPKE